MPKPIKPKIDLNIKLTESWTSLPQFLNHQQNTKLTLILNVNCMINVFY